MAQGIDVSTEIVKTCMRTPLSRSR